LFFESAAIPAPDLKIGMAKVGAHGHKAVGKTTNF
jgi:hypothetical protein